MDFANDSGDLRVTSFPSDSAADSALVAKADRAQRARKPKSGGFESMNLLPPVYALYACMPAFANLPTASLAADSKQ